MEEFSLFNNSFNVQKSSTYNIVMQLGLDGYSFTIVDAIRKRFNAVKHTNFKESYIKTDSRYMEQVTTYIDEDAFLNKNYKSVSLVYNFPEIMIIPENYFMRDEIKKMFLLNFPLHEDEELQYNKIDELKIYIVFSVPSDLTNYFVNKFPQVEFYHQVTLWLKSLQKVKLEKDYAALYFNKSFFNFIYFEGGKMIYFKTLNFENAEDVIYHVTDILNSHGKDASKIDYLLAGDIDEKDDVYSKFNKYLPYHSFFKISEFSSIIYMFDKLPEHKLLSVLSV